MQFSYPQKLEQKEILNVRIKLALEKKLLLQAKIKPWTFPHKIELALMENEALRSFLHMKYSYSQEKALEVP